MKTLAKKRLNFDLVPGCILAAVLPLIVRMKLTDVSTLSAYPWFPSDTERMDFFMYYRGILFLILCAWMLIVLVDRMVLRRKCRFTLKTFWSLLAYALLAVISTCFSVNHVLSLQGMSEQYESIWVLLGYCVTVIYFYEVMESLDDIKIVLITLLISCGITCILGIFQLFGLDFFGTALGQTLIVPNAYSNYRDTITLTFGEDLLHRVYMTFYNPNYAGTYLLLVTPLIIAAFLFCKKRMQKVFLALLGIAAFICLIGTGSKTAWILFALGVFLCILLYFLRVKKHHKVLLCGIGIFLVSLISIDFATGHLFSNYLKDDIFIELKPYRLESVAPENDGVYITFAGQDLCLRFVSDDAGSTYLAVSDTAGTPYPLEYNEEMSAYHINQKPLAKLYFFLYQKEGTPYFGFFNRNTSWTFTNDTEDGSYTYITLQGKPDTIENAYSIFPASVNTWLSSRGYIWGRAIPLLKKTLLIGTGPDTFAVTFPQNDYFARAVTGKRCYEEILTKAHNMYLQTGLQTGVLSLIMLLIFWGRYMIASLKLFLNKKAQKKTAHWIILAILISVTAYLISGMMNDSMLVTAPLFWALLGTGMAVNEKLL